MCVHRTKTEEPSQGIFRKRFGVGGVNMRKGLVRKLMAFIKQNELLLTTAIILPIYVVKFATAVPIPGNQLMAQIEPDQFPFPRDGQVTPAPPLTKPGFINGFVSSLSMIVVSELGDKTFFIAAIMAMRHARFTVFIGAMTALGFMTVLSALFGYVTTVIPRLYTYYISTALFALFGFKMLYDGCVMSGDEGADELEEVQMDLRQREDDENTPLTSSASSNATTTKAKTPSALRRLLFTCFSRVYLQAVTMTFLAEWGDRSQLATVVLAARENIVGICVGGILGHSLCTGLAVLGGRMIAQKISVKTVTILGGIVFLIFAVVSLFLSPN